MVSEMYMCCCVYFLSTLTYFLSSTKEWSIPSITLSLSLFVKVIPSSFDFVEFCTDHRCSNYLDYLERKSIKNPIVYYASEFEDRSRGKMQQQFWNYIFPSPNELRELGIV